MSLMTLGLNHGTAPLDLRGRFAISREALEPCLLGLRAWLAAAQAEVTILSTCNRTELYVAHPAAHTPAHGSAPIDPTGSLVNRALAWMATQGGMSEARLRDHTYVKTEDAAARHAFRVAAGLDSMVLGESQILGQMKQAVRQADEVGALGSTLHQLFQRSFAVAKEVRTHTEIGAHSVSMAAATAHLAERLFGDLSSVTVLFVGAGEMIEKVAAHVAARTPRAMAVAARHPERRARLCESIGAEPIALEHLARRLSDFDVVISCTASSLPLIGQGAVRSALQARRHRPMLMIDLAVPRDIEPEVGDLPDIYLHTVDDLAALVHTASDRRQAAVHRAEQIVTAGVDDFRQWLSRRATVPLIQALHQHAEGLRRHEIEKARRALARGEAVESVLETLGSALTAKLLHGALRELHDSRGDTHRERADTVQRLFLCSNAAGRSARGSCRANA